MGEKPLLLWSENGGLISEAYLAPIHGGCITDNLVTSTNRRGKNGSFISEAHPALIHGGDITDHLVASTNRGGKNRSLVPKV